MGCHILPRDQRAPDRDWTVSYALRARIAVATNGRQVVSHVTMHSDCPDYSIPSSLDVIHCTDDMTSPKH